MSKAFKCNRCDELREGSPENTVCTTNGDGDVLATYELCRVCWKAFEQFLKSGKDRIIEPKEKRN